MNVKRVLLGQQRKEEILAFVDRHPYGVTRPAIAKHFELNIDCVQAATESLRQGGNLHVVGWSKSARWFTPGNAEEALAYHAICAPWAREAKANLGMQGNGDHAKARAGVGVRAAAPEGAGECLAIGDRMIWDRRYAKPAAAPCQPWPMRRKAGGSSSSHRSAALSRTRNFMRMGSAMMVCAKCAAGKR